MFQLLLDLSRISVRQFILPCSSITLVKTSLLAERAADHKHAEAVTPVFFASKCFKHFQAVTPSEKTLANHKCHQNTRSSEEVRELVEERANHPLFFENFSLSLSPCSVGELVEVLVVVLGR